MEFQYCCYCCYWCWGCLWFLTRWQSSSNLGKTRKTHTISFLFIQAHRRTVDIVFCTIPTDIEWRKHSPHFIDYFVSRFRIAQFTHRKKSFIFRFFFLLYFKSRLTKIQSQKAIIQNCSIIDIIWTVSNRNKSFGKPWNMSFTVAKYFFFFVCCFFPQYIGDDFGFFNAHIDFFCAKWNVK